MSFYENAELYVISSGPDWLTATTKPGVRHSIVAAATTRWMEERARSGYRVKPFSWQGYNGQSIDGITIGERPDGGLCRLSGEMAALHVSTAVTWVSNVSRLDLQVTLFDEDKSRDWATYGLLKAKEDRRVQSGMTRTSQIRSTPSGVTTYIGSRSSDRYFRIYDKTAESVGAFPARCWRYEIEYKQGRAVRVMEHLRTESFSPAAVAAVVEQSFLDYGIRLPMKKFTVGWKDTSPKVETNDEKRLTWLTTSIKPMIQRLSEAFPRSVLLEAIGLDGDLDVFTGELSSTDVEVRVPHPIYKDVFLVSDG